LYDNLFGCYILGNSTSCTNAITAATTFNSTCSTGSGCDDLRRDGESMLLTYDWLYSQLSGGQRSSLISNFNTWMTNQNGVTWGGATMPASNYFSGRNRNDFTLGVATIEDSGTASTYLDYGLSTLWPALTNFVSLTGTGTLGGKGYGLYTQEGGGEYGRYSLSYYSLMNPSAKLLGRNLWEETTGFKAGALQTIYNTFPANTTSRSMRDMFTWADDELWMSGNACGYQSHNGPDGHGGCGASSQYYGDFMQAVVNEWPTTAVGKTARTWVTDVAPAIGPIQRSVDPGGSSQAYSTLPLDYYSSGAQYMYTRNNWTGNATSILWQMGLNRGSAAGHAHHDAGTFQVFRKGAILIKETPTYSETVAGYGGTGTISGAAGFAHNIPVVGGVGSNTTLGASTDGFGIVQRVDTNTNYAFAAVDLTKTYQNTITDGGHPERSNPYAVSVIREYYYFRNIDSMVIVDRIQKDTSGRSTAFISHCETAPTLTSPTALCTVSGQSAKYTSLFPASPTMASIAENANAATANNWQYRIESENPNPGNVVTYNIYSIQFCDSGSCSQTPSILDSNSGSATSGTFTITVDGSNSLVLNKGIASSGGSITAEGVASNLSTTVHPMTITDNGPVWDYVAPPDSIKPTTTTNKSGRYTTKQTMTLTASDDVEVSSTLYCLTFGTSCTPSLTYSTPFTMLQNVAKQTACYSSTDTSSNIETAKCTTLLKQKRR
jgi:hypothetical protein